MGYIPKINRKQIVPSTLFIIKSFILLFVFLITINKATYSQEDSEMQMKLPIYKLFEQSKYQPLQWKLGINLGWDYAYSNGIDLSLLVDELFDINVGAGIELNGVRVGFGGRIFPFKDQILSPMLGVFLYYSAGREEIEISELNKSIQVYKINPCTALLFNTGLRFRYANGNYLILGIGYSDPFRGGGELEHISGKERDRNEETESKLEAITVGGLSINISLLLKISKGNYLKNDHSVLNRNY